jgi:hypothetical protein
MNSSVLLRRAASAMRDPRAYAPKSTALVQLATKQPYGATQALERANCRLRSGNALCARGDDGVLAEAKAKVCRVVGFPHLDLWEWHKKPDWQDVRQAFLVAA